MSTSAATTAARWVTISEVAAHFGVSNRTIHRWIKRGLPKHKPGNLMFDLEECDAWVRNRCFVVTPGSEVAA
jgi:excisionase family DNA binding protein